MGERSKEKSQEEPRCLSGSCSPVPWHHQGSGPGVPAGLSQPPNHTEPLADAQTGRGFLFVFKSTFRFTEKNEGKVQRIPYILSPFPLLFPPYYQHFTSVWFICYNWCTGIDTLLLAKVIHIVIPSWWCTFPGFWQLYNDMYPPLQNHIKYLHCPKNPLCSTSSALSSPSQQGCILIFHSLEKCVYFSFSLKNKWW